MSIRSGCGRVMIAVVIALASLGTRAVPSEPPVWEGRFSQCSYNAVSDVLIHFEGPIGDVPDREAFERKTFFDPVTAAGYSPYYGWGPWTGYMVESQKMVWNGKPVTDLKAESFSLRPKAEATVRGSHIILVHYAAGERAALKKKLLAELAKGPVVLWTPYAGALRIAGREPWHHVKKIDEHTDAVPFGPFTHSVALFLQPDKSILVDDCSVRDGIYPTDADTIVSTSAAMTGFVRIKNQDGKSMLDRGFNGIKDDEYNVVFYRDSSAPTSQPAEK